MFVIKHVARKEGKEYERATKGMLHTAMDRREINSSFQNAESEDGILFVSRSVYGTDKERRGKDKKYIQIRIINAQKISLEL